MKRIDRLRQRVEVTKEIIKNEHEKVWKKCRAAYLGNNWKEGSPNHTINLIWSTIMTELPGLYFGMPKYKLKPTTRKMTEMLKLKNEAILKKILGTMPFSEVIKNTILSAHIDLGMVEWGCDSIFVANPNAGQPVMTMGQDPMTGEMKEDYLRDLEGTPVLEPDEITDKDSFYIRRIKATDAGFDPNGGEVFDELSWFWVRDYLTKKEIKEKYNVSSKKLSGASYVVKGYEKIDETEAEEIAENRGLEEEKDYKRIAVYRMFDRIEEKVYVFCDGVENFLSVDDYPETEPFAILKFSTKPGEFYQIPEIYPILDAQTEIEIAANMRSEHMKRNARKIWVQEGAVDDNEIQKLEKPYTMSIVKVKKGANSMGAIDFGAVDSTIYNHEAVTQDQFNQLAGMASSHRGGAQKKQTATAEMIQDKYQGIRQREKGILTRDFLIKIGNGILNCIHENLTLPMEVEIIGRDESPKLVQYVPIIDIHRNFDCELDVRSFAAPSEELERAQWLSLLDLVGRYPHIFTNPILAKETLLRHQIESVDLQNALVQMATQMIQSQLLQQAQGAGGKNQKGSAPQAKMRGPAQGMAQLMGSQIGR